MRCVAYTVRIAGSIGENAVRVPCDRLGSCILLQ